MSRENEGRRSRCFQTYRRRAISASVLPILRERACPRAHGQCRPNIMERRSPPTSLRSACVIPLALAAYMAGGDLDLLHHHLDLSRRWPPRRAWLPFSTQPSLPRHQLRYHHRPRTISTRPPSSRSRTICLSILLLVGGCSNELQDHCLVQAALTEPVIWYRTSNTALASTVDCPLISIGFKNQEA